MHDLGPDAFEHAGGLSDAGIDRASRHAGEIRQAVREVRPGQRCRTRPSMLARIGVGLIELDDVRGGAGFGRAALEVSKVGMAVLPIWQARRQHDNGARRVDVRDPRVEVRQRAEHVANVLVGLDEDLPRLAVDLRGTHAIR